MTMEEDGEIDPLDAYMASIQAEVATNEMESKRESQLVPSELGIGEDSMNNAEINGSDYDNDGDSSNDEKADPNKKASLANTVNLNNPQELIAFMAQTVGKRKDLVQVDHSNVHYQPFRKSFYIESPVISEMTEEEVDLYREELDGIKIRGKKCPRPIKKWVQCGLDTRMFEVIKRCNYEKPTAIQAQALPAIMSGRDIIGIAKTGSGKTIAFLLPMFRHILDQPPLLINEGPIGLVLTPTRELAMQTYFECKKFAHVLGLRVVCACGGSPIKEQIGDLKRGAEIIIGTPGRLIELLIANSGRVINLRRTTFLVLDEADRMFDMGFGPQVLRIVGNIRPDRQAVLFSATFPRQMEALARKILHKPLEIVVGGRSVVCSDVTQIVEVLEEDGKFFRLLEILGEWYPEKASKILIFVDKQDSADLLMRDLLKRGYPTLSTHGGKDQADRESALADFKSGVAPLLVATSVVARGLDVKDLNLVINYECPNHMEDYVHRVGRTGRAGNKGTAYTFVTMGQEQYAADICKALRSSQQIIPERLEALANAHLEKVSFGQAKTAGSGFGGKGLDRIEEEHKRMRKTQKRILQEESESSTNEEEIGEHEERVNLSIVGRDGIVEGKLDGRMEGMADGDDERIGQAKLIKLASSSTASTTGMSTSNLPSKHQSTAMPVNALAKIREITAKISSTAGSSEDAVASINARYLKGTPTGVSGEIYPVFDSTQAIRAYFCEIDLNDYPQIVRFRITHKDTVHHVCEISGGVALTIRGEYIPAGKTIKEGQRKLHVRIDGETEYVVERARNEIRRLLVEYTREAADRGAIDYARYDL